MGVLLDESLDQLMEVARFRCPLRQGLQFRVAAGKPPTAPQMISTAGTRSLKPPDRRLKRETVAADRTLVKHRTGIASHSSLS
jgi:hypothetical protein